MSELNLDSLAHQSEETRSANLAAAAFVLEAYGAPTSARNEQDKVAETIRQIKPKVPAPADVRAVGGAIAGGIAGIAKPLRP